MPYYLSPLGNEQQFFNASGDPLTGAKLFTYLAGSTTKQTTYKNNAGSVSNTNPIVLGSDGRPADPIWLTGSLSYKLVLAPSTDTDPPTSPIWTIDSISGINDSSVSIDQWITGPAPTYVSATSFTLVGDQTSTFHVGRRLKLTDSGGTDYGVITVSVYATLTTITVVLDSGSLESGLSAVSYSLLSASNPSVPGVRISGLDWTHSGTITMSGKSLWQAEGAAVASAADCNIWTTDGGTVHITGTTAPSDWGTAPQAGASKWCTNDSALTLTYNATTNILPGDADIALPANSWWEVYANSTSTYEVRQILFSDGRSLGLVSGTVTATTSGTSHDYTIPPWAKKITGVISNYSTNGTSIAQIQLGDAGGIEPTDYIGEVNNAAAAGNAVNAYVSGFLLSQGWAAASVWHFHFTLTLVDPVNFTWFFSCVGGNEGDAAVATGGGVKSLSAALTTVRLTTVNGTDASDAGSFNVMWE